MNFLKLAITSLVLGCLPSVVLGFQNPDEPMLSVLSQYEGVWDSEFSYINQDGMGADEKFTGVVEGKWIVDGRFLDQTGKYQVDEASGLFIIKTVMSYHEKDQNFRFVYFMSSGDIQHSVGNWDPDKKTMTSRMKNDEDDDGSTTIVADFSTENVEQWSIESRDGNGKITGRIAGTNKRRATR